MDEDIVYRLKTRADIRDNAATRKSVQEGKVDRLSALLREAATLIQGQRILLDILLEEEGGGP